MREIIFRGKRADTGEWIEGDLLQNVDCLKIREQEKDLKHIARSFVIIPETAGQYTGLKDKNGKKIFEGDFISSNWGYKGIVELDTIMYAMCECLFNEDCEIIGNIHEKPELMEGEG